MNLNTLDPKVISQAIKESKIKGKQVYLNPLQANSSPSLIKEPARLIQIKDIKVMFESMLRSFLHLTKKFKIMSNRVVNIPRIIQCKTFRSSLHSPSYLHDLYKEFHSINKENYTKKPRNLLKTLQAIMLEVGNNCTYIIEYIDFFKNIIKRQSYLKKRDFHNPWLLLQVLSSRGKFLNSWGKYVKMGHYLGNFFAWYKIYSPKRSILSNPSGKRRWKQRDYI